MDYRIRIATADDIESIGGLWVLLLEDQMKSDPYYSGDFKFNYDRNHFEDAMNDTACSIIVVEAEGRVVGYIEIHQYNSDNIFFIDDYAYILNTYIEPEYRFSAFELFKAAEEWAVSKGCNYLQADVFIHNQTVRELLHYAKLSPYMTRFAKKLTENK